MDGKYKGGIESPAFKSEQKTVTGTVTPTAGSRAIIVDASGTLSLQLLGDTKWRTFPLTGSVVHPLRVKKIRATGTITITKVTFLY